MGGFKRLQEALIEEMGEENYWMTEAEYNAFHFPNSEVDNELSAEGIEVIANDTESAMDASDETCNNQLISAEMIAFLQ